MKCGDHFKSNGYWHRATNNFKVYTSLKEIGLKPEEKMSYRFKKILRLFGTRKDNIYILLKYNAHEGKGFCIISKMLPFWAYFVSRDHLHNNLDILK